MKAIQKKSYRDGIEAEPISVASGSDEFLDDRSVGNSTATCDDCAEILPGLNNVLAGMLLNAQVMEWKLPSCSRSKRYLHEIERNAQRGGGIDQATVGAAAIGMQTRVASLAALVQSLKPAVRATSR